MHQIAIEPETPPAELVSDKDNSSMYLDNPYDRDLARGLMIRMSNTVHPSLSEDPDGCAEGAIMLADISNVDAIYIVCGRTDMRKSIDGLCAIIQDQFSMEIDHALYLFCGRRCDRIKAILKEP